MSMTTGVSPQTMTYVYDDAFLFYVCVYVTHHHHKNLFCGGPISFWSMNVWSMVIEVCPMADVGGQPTEASSSDKVPFSDSATICHCSVAICHCLVTDAHSESDSCCC